VIVFATLSAASAVARANSPLVVHSGSAATVFGEKSYSEVHIESGGTLKVKAYDLTDPNRGSLHIQATKIVVDEGGIIDASGAGYPGPDSQSGEGPGGGQLPTSDGLPGGGGGSIGAGSQGTDPTCAFVGGLGGTKYGDGMTAQLGSAGGAAKILGMSFGGGAGGGVLFLEANTIEINGTVTVAGADGRLTGPHGSGGGGGGTLHISAYDFKVGPKAVISAAGGNGAAGSKDSGGGGGGGLILLAAQAPMSWSPQFGGGISGTCMGVPGEAGSLVQLAVPMDCFDLDNDKTSACDGDCDDVDPLIHPGLPDKCDSVDNDCSGGVDDPKDPSALCAPGLVCDAGVEEGGTNKCYAAEPDAGDTGPRPDGVDFRGGCSTGHAGAASAAAALAVWTLALASRRRRRRR